MSKAQVQVQVKKNSENEHKRINSLIDNHYTFRNLNEGWQSAHKSKLHS
jgi:hypothetical protein